MPPRRSSRTTALEAPSDAATGKRKRSESRTRTKPTSTASTSSRRPSVGPERTSRSTKTRGVNKLQDVPEIEEGSDLNEEGLQEVRERVENVDERWPDAPPARKKPRKSAEDDEEHQDEEEEVRKPSRRGRSRQVVTEEEELAPKTPSASARPPSKITGDAHSTPSPESPGKGQDSNHNSSVDRASQTPRRAPPVEEEEEKSLLEPRVRPQSQSQLPPVEEPKGPTTRLVIHKMVMVNFKSYAGKQEIGPFHKVCVVSFASDPLTLNIYAEVFFVHRWSKWLWKIKHHRRSLVRIRISCIENASG